MAPRPPEIPGLFTDYRKGRPTGIDNITLWNDIYIRRNPVTRQCLVTKVHWYKGRANLQHEYLRFDISSPDKAHTAILIAERLAGDITKDKHANPMDPAIGPGIPSKASSSSNSISRRLAKDEIVYATLDSIASAPLEQRCKDSDCISTLTFPEDAGPSANKIATLLVVTSALEPTYQLMNTQCYWFVATVFEALKCLFPGAKQDITGHTGGTWYQVRIPKKSSVDAACAKYKVAQSLLDVEIEEEHRVQQEVPVLLFEFAIYTYHNLNSEKKRGDGKLKNSGLQRKGNASNVGQRTSNIGQRTSNIGQRTSNIGQRTSNIGQRTSNAKLQRKPREGNASNAKL
ncbi:hypothetical protein PISMIDRAFT_91642 [Pisolithus microcarpus 441]|uniref:Uncharacterized protein n=1 Tax=Pisolithus microcarpus 441 TaxID=765257 RepID=A0A0D0A803_9AGAM|nr:hypothetical protein PISMIDRAFT_91642 [Pisolithus microcarpus 441]